MIDIPPNLNIPKAEAKPIPVTAASGNAAAPATGSKDIIKDLEVTSSHRNSVTARESLAKNPLLNLKTIPKKNHSAHNSNASIKNEPTPPLALINPTIHMLNTVVREDSVNSISEKKSTSEATTHPLKARFLSFSKRIKGTVTGITSQTSEASKTNKVIVPPTASANELKNKTNSTAKLPSFTNRANLPSASAYDITLANAHQLPKNLDEYYVIRRVGKGGFATVFLVRLKVSTGRYYALKVIKKSEVVRLKQEKQIMNEKNILLELKHPLLIDLYTCFQSPSNLFMVLEFVAGGDLFTLLRKSKMFVEQQAKFYICEVLTVLEYLHNMKVVYRDLKPENILLDSTGHIKLADFGFAKRLSGTTMSFCGTPDYIAAEIVASRPYSFPVDWWSLGVLIFELISGKTPFRADDSEGIYTNIQIGKIQWVPEVTGPIKELCMGLLETEPKKRLGTKGAEDIKKSTWFAGIQWDKIAHRGVHPPVIPLAATPEALEMEKVAKGGQTDYRDILGDSLPDGKFSDPYDSAFKGF